MLQSDFKNQFPNEFELTANNMAVNFLRNAPQNFYNYLCDFSGQTVLHGPIYFLNHGSIQGGKEIKRNLEIRKHVTISMSTFDR